MKKMRLASLWLDGCSGCHMSLLDLDLGILDLAARVDLVYSPLVDARVFPEDVDVTLVEGAVGYEPDIDDLRHIRRCTRTLVAFGDCAVTANVPGLRNAFPLVQVLDRAYGETGDGGGPPGEVPRMLARVRPLHEIVAVDVYLPGCPPPSDAIAGLLASLLDGKPLPAGGLTRFGA